MNFTTFEFLLFLVVFFPTYFILPKKLQKFALLFFNFYYISFYKVEFLYFILGISALFYISGNLLEKYKNKKFILFFSLFCGVGMLIYLKFFSYFLTKLCIQSTFLNSLANKIYLPLGISFYSLQGVAYVVDIYKSKYKAEKNFVHFLLYITFFPIFLQGPISRYEQLKEQLITYNKFDYKQFCFGLQLALWGLFKKLVISNRLNMISNEIFNKNTEYTGIIILLSGMCYALELYTDFSGAVDISRGIAQSMNIELVQNFNFPNSATSIKDFWSRWHISLSAWLRDYIYIPLGGSRKGKFRKYINIIITFFVSGLWHGVGFKFIIWGLLHAFYQIFADLTDNFFKKIKDIFKYKKILKIISDNNNLEIFISKFITFSLVSIAWIFFRASDWKIAYSMVKKINKKFLSSIGKLTESGSIDKKDFIVLIISLLILYLSERISQQIRVREKISSLILPLRWFLYILLIHIIVIFGIYGEGYNPANFIYMGF
ncbi:MBOAT family O-acyltransferase [Fusobacterium nucleatum]|nr:MBOAT family O-acyltransferase [Fusobacterium nucleatum]MCL4576829.1 membrane protein [Fusobacterium nucleatum YWH7056]MCL4584067.1 membrane protein [Fusobacterium nucleatum YWH7054]MCL4592069.1 membrane protein [Fusobacterium nucleatum YWH7053]